MTLHRTRNIRKQIQCCFKNSFERCQVVDYHPFFLKMAFFVTGRSQRKSDYSRIGKKKPIIIDRVILKKSVKRMIGQSLISSSQWFQVDRCTLWDVIRVLSCRKERDNFLQLIQAAKAHACRLDVNRNLFWCRCFHKKTTLIVKKAIEIFKMHHLNVLKQLKIEMHQMLPQESKWVKIGRNHSLVLSNDLKREFEVIKIVN